MSSDGERAAGLRCEAAAGKYEELEPVYRNDLAQSCVTSLKDSEQFKIDEPEKLRTGRVLKGPRGQFGAKRGGKNRQRAEELQPKKLVHATSHTSKTFSLS